MNLVLNVYKDDTLTEIKRTVEADRLKIPYRVALTVAQSLDDLDLTNLQDSDVVKVITGNLDKVDKIIKATFGVTDTELECVDVTELSAVALEIYSYVMSKFNDLHGGSEKN